MNKKNIQVNLKQFKFLFILNNSFNGILVKAENEHPKGNNLINP